MEEGFNPLVSIIIPVYNGANYMKEAIDSALSQTYKNTEVIVVNDGSRDGGETERIAKEYGDRIIYLSKENGGVSTALNMGIRAMKGEYFSWLSHDDVYTEDKIEKQVNALKDKKNRASLVMCAYSHIDKNSAPIGSKPRRAASEVQHLTWQQMLLSLFRTGPMSGCALLIPGAVFDKVGLFDETLRFYQDGFMWFRIFSEGYGVISIPDCCVMGRIHDKQLTQTGQAMFESDCEKISNDMIPTLIKLSTREYNFISAYAKYNAKYGNTAVVKKALNAARGANILHINDRIAIALLRAYGAVRPLIRKIYYAVFRRVRTA